MSTFDELGLGPEIVEGLTAEGIETPTFLQGHAIPVLRRGNSAVLRAGPGAGVLATYGPALLDRLPPGARQPHAVILVPTREGAHGLATSLSRLALATGHRVAALGVPWALPALADLLFSTPRDLLGAIQSAEVKVEAVEALILDGAAALLDGPERELLEGIRDALPEGEVQWVVVSEPLTPSVRAFVDERMKRAVFLPPDASKDVEEDSPVQRGGLTVRTVEGSKEEAVLAAVAEELEEGRHHVLLYCRSDDRAADTGDFLSLHGYVTDAPGSPEAPVWLGLDAMEGRKAVREADGQGRPVAVVSVDVPADADTLDRRHGAAPDHGAALALPRELPHLRRIAREAGYALVHRVDEPPGGGARADEIVRFRGRIEAALTGEDLGPYLLLLEPLLERWGSAEVAAALAALLRKEDSSAPGEAASRQERGGGPPSVGQPPPTAWVKLFLSVGERDGIGPGDVVGAITGEAGVEGHRIGRIEIRDTFSRVDVEESVASRVIQALNGVSLKGRSVRADYDRTEGRTGRGGPERGHRSGKGRSGGRGSARKPR
jgi:ATP-dependent RNA helicase DeaD